MDLKSLRYGVQYGAQYGPRLTEKYCRGATFFLRRTRAPNVYTSARNIVHQNSKFFEPWNWHKELLYSSYFLFKFRSNCLMSTFCLFTFLSANIVMFFVVMTPFSAVMFMIECSVTQSDILSQIWALREKCPNTKYFLVRILPLLDWIRRDM